MFVQVNLMQYMKLSTSRDFRINAATLEAALQEQDDSPDVSPSYETIYFPSEQFWINVLSFFRPQSLSRQRHKSPNRRRENIRIRKRDQLPGGKSSCGESAGWSSERYVPLFREPLVMLMIW